MSEVVGARYYAIDFHVHTPASGGCYKDKQATPKEIVSAAIQAKLHAIAITDHNTPAWIEPVEEAARDSGLVVFPGVEINARGGHVIALFDPSDAIDSLETTLIEAGIPKSKWGQEGALAEDFVDVLAAIRKNGGLAIAAHADGQKGFLDAIQQGATRTRILQDDNLSALELVSLEQKDQYVQGSGPACDRPIPCIQGSDAHSPNEIGGRYSLVRMQHLSLEGVRQAFFEPELRIRTPAEWSAPTYPYVASLSVEQVFLAGQTFRFNPSLNCLVGGAGSGKSTVIEFLRFALDQVSGLDECAKDCLGKLADLAGVGASIEVVVVLEGGEQITVTRTFDGETDPISIRRASDGQLLEDVDLRGLFPIHAYSQGEGVSISRSPLAQLELLDKHLDLAIYQDEIKQARRELSAQIAGLVKLEAATRDRERVERDVATTKAQIHSRTSELESLEEAQRSSVVTSHQLWISERGYLRHLVDSFKRTRQEVEEKVQEIELYPLTVPLPEEDTPNRVLLDECRQLTLPLEQARDEAKKAMLKTLDEIQDEVVARARRWEKLYETHSAEYRKQQVQAGAARITEINTRLEDLRTKLHALRSKLTSIEAAEKTLNNQWEKRKRLLETIRDRRDRIYHLRKRKAKELVKKIGDTIALKVVRDGNREQYRRLVGGLLKGTYAQRPVIDAICTSVHPTNLARHLRAESARDIDEESGLGQRWARVLIDRASSQPEFVHEMEAVPVEDLLDISFKVGRGQYRALGRLSTGQKATVIVLLTMVEGKEPIIFDQPEDALYTPFIYAEVVKTLRREKDQRQFVLATHNPNIAIAGDTDYGIVLEGTATEARVESAGGLDDQSTRQLMILHLEGGADAFLTRGKKLGLQ